MRWNKKNILNTGECKTKNIPKIDQKQDRYGKRLYEGRETRHKTVYW